MNFRIFRRRFSRFRRSGANGAMGLLPRLERAPMQRAVPAQPSPRAARSTVECRRSGHHESFSLAGMGSPFT
jgi:hypothetical protein